MSKLDSMMKCEQARSLVKEKHYREAYEIIEDLSIDSIKPIADLKLVAEIYEKLDMYDEARDIYFRLYDRTQSRMVIYQLTILSIKCGLMDEAEDFFEEYKERDKSSIDLMILGYYMEKARGADHKERIRMLEAIREEEPMEEWCYELAKLYHKEGMAEKCVKECEEIILFFGEGVIVEKAMLLKMHYESGVDISSEQAIERTKNLSAELKIAAKIAEENERRREEELQREITLDSEEDVDKMLHELQVEETSIESAATEDEEEDYDPLKEDEVYTEYVSWLEKLGRKTRKEQEDRILGHEAGGQDHDSLGRKKKKKKTLLSPADYADPLDGMSKGEYNGSGNGKDSFSLQGTDDFPFRKDREEQNIENNTLHGRESLVEGVDEKLDASSVNFAAYQTEADKNDEDDLYRITEPEQDNELKLTTQDLRELRSHISRIDKEQQINNEIERLITEAQIEGEFPHFCVIGDDEEAIKKSAKRIARELCTRQILPTPKVAKITAEKLNQIRLADKQSQLDGVCLLIENVHQLSINSLQGIFQMLRKYRRRIVLVLADDAEGMHKFLENNRKMKKIIKNRITID